MLGERYIVAENEELKHIIKEKDKIIDELMAENKHLKKVYKEYREMYWDSRSRQDKGC